MLLIDTLQVEAHPNLRNEELLQYNKGQGIHVTVSSGNQDMWSVYSCSWVKQGNNFWIIPALAQTDVRGCLLMEVNKHKVAEGSGGYLNSLPSYACSLLDH